MASPAGLRTTIDLDAGASVIADLHLDVGPAGVEPRAFLEFLRAQRGSPRLVILGDLFDAWIGPAQMELPAAARVVAALRELVDSGTPVDIVVGNRDFLLDARFERRSGATVHREGFVARLGDGSSALLVHGDEFCTRDVGYQRLKRVLRSAPLLWGVPRLPRSLALAAARRLRRASVQAVQAKPSADKQQQREVVGELAEVHACELVVCGHAHELRDEAVPKPGGGSARWIVLDAFGGQHDVLHWGPNGRVQLRSSALHAGRT